MKPVILYVSYDGMLEPLGQSQVLAYLERLSLDHDIRLISFEKKRDWADHGRRRQLRNRMAAANIHWIPLRYHKAPSAPATAFDIMMGSLVLFYQLLRHRAAIIHARSYIPGVMALIVKRLTGARFLFDMRGFWADERIDGGIWPAGGRLYRLAKAVEHWLLGGADHIVTLTRASEREIRSFPALAGKTIPIDVITTCADLERFCPDPSRRPETFVLGHVGSVGTWYLLDETLLVFRHLLRQRPDARLRIVNRGEHDRVLARVSALEIDRDKVDLMSADHAEVARFINGMRAGMAIITPAYSKIASAPTKLAEYLGCGIPCLVNRGVGDVAEIVEEHGVGMVLNDFSDQTIAQGVRDLLALCEEGDIVERCRAAAEQEFSLAKGVASYAGIYAALNDRTCQGARR